MINNAIIHRPSDVNTMTGNVMRPLGIIAPKLNKLLLSTLYQITDDSDAAKASANEPETVVDKTTQAMDALQKLDLNKKTLESIASVLNGHHT